MKNLLKRSISAGIMISLGGYIYIKTYENNRYIAALLFSIGLLSVLYLRYDLFTGKVCNIVSNLSESYIAHDKYYISYNKRPMSKPNNPLYYIIVLLGNSLGCLIMAAISVHTKLDAYSICCNKIDKSPLNLFCSAIICEICIAIAVWVFNAAKDKNTNIIVILAVVIFIVSGSEHCIADMYYFLIDLFDGMPSVNPIIGLEVIIIVIMGNLIGGVLMNLICKE